MNAPMIHLDTGALASVLRWVSPRFGPIRRLECAAEPPPEPPWWIGAAELSRCPCGTYSPGLEVFAAGASLEPAEAFRRVLGESVERICGLEPPHPRRIRRVRFGDGELWRRFPRCGADETIPEGWRPARADDPITQTTMRYLADGRSVTIPAGFVFQQVPRPRGEPLVAPSISTGLAFHTDLVTAIWRGLCEVVERDALMCAWWLRGPLRPLETESGELPDDLARRLALLRRAGLQAHLLDITTEVPIPTVLCLVQGQAFPLIACGAASHADANRACTKAIDEAMGVRHYLRKDPRSRSTHFPDFNSVRTLADHALFYATGRGNAEVNRLRRDAGPPISLVGLAQKSAWGEPTREAGLGRVARCMERLGLTVLWAELTTPEAAPLGHVVRVVVPEMVPLSGDHRVRWLGTPRLLHRARAADQPGWNPWPHPFA